MTQTTVTETKHDIDGYAVTFMSFGADKRLFITNPEGIQIYGHRTSGLNYLETAKREIADDVDFRARLAQAEGGEMAIETVQEIAVEGESRPEPHIEYDLAEVFASERIVIPSEINDGFHRTYDGRRIPIGELESDHLLRILPKMVYSKRKYQYVREALRRGYLAQVKAAGMYSDAYSREVAA